MKEQNGTGTAPRDEGEHGSGQHRRAAPPLSPPKPGVVPSRRPRRRRRRPPVPGAVVGCVLLALLLGAALWPTLGAGHLTNTDELFTAERAREMNLPGGDPWTVRENFVVTFRKPPLQYWLTAASLRLFGGADPERAARLPSLLYAVGTAVLTGALAHALPVPVTRRRSPPAAWGVAVLATAIFVTSPMILPGAGHARLDLGLAFWTSLTLLAALRAGGKSPPWSGHVDNGEKGRWWWLVAGAAAALGAWQKAAPLATAALLVVAALRVGFLPPGGGQPRRVVVTPWMIAGLTLALAGTAAWPLLQAVRHGMPAADAFALREAAELTGAERLGARAPLAIFDRLAWRWWWGAFALLAAVFTLGRGVRGASWRGGRRGRAALGPAAELAAVCLLTVVVATVVGFRSARYVVPVVPGLCALAAVVIGQTATMAGRRFSPTRPGWPSWRPTVAAALTTGLFVAVTPGAFRKVADRDPEAPDQFAFARTLGAERTPGEEIWLLRGATDRVEDTPGGVLPDGFYLFYGDLREPVRGLSRVDLAAMAAPGAGRVAGVCRAEDFSQVTNRLPGAEIMETRGGLVRWRWVEQSLRPGV